MMIKDIRKGEIERFVLTKKKTTENVNHNQL